MQPCPRALLALALVLGAAVAVAVALPAPPAPSGYQEALAAAVDTYNRESGQPQAYRLLEAEPQPPWDLASQPVQPLRFSIKETTCLVSEKRDVGQCPFKDEGLVKDCTGIYSAEKKPPIVTAVCKDAGQEPELVKRVNWRKIGLGASYVMSWLG